MANAVMTAQLLETIDYTEADADFDSGLMLTEVGDFTHVHQDDRSLRTKLQRSTEDETHASDIDSVLADSVSGHMKNIRFLKFAREALAAEKEAQYCYIDMEYEKFNASQQKQSGALDTSASASQSIDDESSAYLIAIDEHVHSSAVVINARDIDGVQAMISPSDVTLESSMKQLKKDIERDRLVINGQRVVGAELGLEKTLELLGDICDCTLQECGITKLSAVVRDHYALTVLSKAARSHSGGIAFQAAQTLIDPLKSILVPQSVATPPLQIIAYVGVFPIIPMPSNNKKEQQSIRSQRKWGLVCRVLAESIFCVQSFDAPRGNDTRRPPARFQPIDESSVMLKGNKDHTSAAGGAAESVEDYVKVSVEKITSNSIESAKEQLSLEHNSYISVVYRDYVMFQVNLTETGEMSNILNLVNDWEQSATVSVCNVEAVYQS